MIRRSAYVYLINVISIVSLLIAASQNCEFAIASAATNEFEPPVISLSQTAELKLAFLDIPSEYVDQSQLMLLLPQSVKQFSHSNTITWTLNSSLVFHTFPGQVSESLQNNAFYWENSVYFNITLLDRLLSQWQNLAIPERGYLLVFMSIPLAADHLWFNVQEGHDLFLGRVDYVDGVPLKYWTFPKGFGGLRRAIYFDLSDVMNRLPTKALITDVVANSVGEALQDIFPDLLGKEDPRMIPADTQKCQHYDVQVLWLNGTAVEIPTAKLQESFEDLMPWTSWTVTVENRPIDAELQNLIDSRTEDLSQPLTYSFALANGTRKSI